MTAQNPFEKYGIKEVADVTIYRIEKKEQTYESQRSITASTILRGALELRDVYPLNDEGVGEEEGFKALVFPDAELNHGTNYDCDDQRIIDAVLKVRYYETEDIEDFDNYDTFDTGNIPYIKKNIDKFFKLALSKLTEELPEPDGEGADKINKKAYEVSFVSAYDIESSMDASSVILKKYSEVTGEEKDVTVKRIAQSSEIGTEIDATYIVKAKLTLKNPTELTTGVYENENSYIPDPVDGETGVGTHEYTYAQQICMLFSKRQNLIAKTGVRYIFENADTLFGNVTFNDEFAAQPGSTERVVVVGLVDKFDEGNYDLDEINEAIAQLKESIVAKAYDVTYTDYAELVVEDEMGYFNPAYLGKNYQREKGIGSITFFSEEDGYEAYVGDKIDNAIADAVMWSDGVHYSINDAIDALKQKKLVLDASEKNNTAGIDSIFGGYKVSSKDTDEVQPTPGTEDIVKDGYTNNIYEFKVENEAALQAAKDKKGNDVTSEYPLADVADAVNDIGRSGAAFGKALRVDVKDGGKTSNRAIYIKVDGSVDTAAGAYIYLLHNKNAKKLSLDKEGIFKFNDKKGNVLYYEDKIFKGIEYLALVILGDKGIIFVVNRHGNKNFEKVAWMVRDKGYVTDNQAKTLVANGLIHTTNVIANNETFEATCTVGDMKIHKTKKTTNRYVPVLFLDTLKVSTIEQTAEEVYATGGRGNANLIGWDYGKTINLTLQDALFTPASMSAAFGAYDGKDIKSGIKEAKTIDRFEKVTAPRSFIVPAGNANGTPTEADKTAQAVYYDPRTMEPYEDGTPIVEGEVFYKYTRSVAYEGQSLGNVIEISADKFPGVYKIVGDTYIRAQDGSGDQRLQFVIPQAKMTSEQTITLEADGDPSVFDMNMTVLRPDDGVMVRLVQYDVVENTEENDGSTMVKGTENLNLLDDAELFKVSDEGIIEESFIGATEY